MDVRLVVLHATVSDASGNPISGLDRSVFRLFVDDQPHPITDFQGEDTPVAVGIVMDQSASMADMRSVVIAAALAFSKVSNPEDEMFVVNFNDKPQLGLPGSKSFTGDRTELEAALSRFKPAGSTALYDAIGMALAHLEKATVSRRVLLIISDGGDNSSHADLASILRWAQNASVALYSVGLFNLADSDRNPQILKELAEATGGKAFFPSDVPEITRVCVTIGRGIRNQYTLGFNGAQDGKYHRIKLLAQDPGYGPLTVHTRPGYQSEKP
jgi:VWFA-related protein